jgi:hypothetical protein
MLPSAAAEPFIADDTLLLVVVGCENALNSVTNSLPSGLSQFDEAACGVFKK